MKKFTVKIKGKTFGEIPNGTIFKPVDGELYYMKIQPRGSIFNAIFATTGYPCLFSDDEKIEEATYRLSEHGTVLFL